ncbi:MAG: hypothetical protein WCF57_05240 [Pyrinomonadaceae bacterium]
MKSAFKSPRADEIDAPRRSWSRGVRVISVTFIVIWGCAVSTGLWILWGYENRPGVSAQAPAVWPADSRIQRARERATLVMLAHPHCPCTRASIGELASLMAHTQGRVTAYVLFLKPEGFSEDWEKTDLWQSASRIPGVSAVIDDGGVEARRFHAATSGQTILYDAEGRLMFSGGITASRGHAGDNAGRSSIVALAGGDGAAAEQAETETFVFGCPLFDKESECQKPGHETDEH